MRLVAVTAPAVEPISLTEAKAHLRVDATADDDLITALIVAARQHLDGPDGVTGRALVTQTWDLRLSGFPVRDDEPIRLPLPPLQSVTSITYVDVDGATQTWAADQYRVLAAGSGQAGILPAYDVSWPATRERVDDVAVRFVAGYGVAAAVPGALRQALLLLVGHWYETREAVAVGTIATEIPFAATALVRPFHVRWR